MLKILLLTSACLFLQASCTKVNQEDKNFIVASIDGKKITLSDLDENLGSAVYNAHKQIYDTRLRILEEMIGEQLLENEAKKRNFTVEQLKNEIMTDAKGVNEKELDRFYEMAKKNSGDQDGNKITREQIKEYLEDRQKVIEERKFISDLKKNAKIENYLSKLEPKMPRLKVEVGNAPTLGPEKAKVTIVEFTTYFCPYCVRAQKVLEQVKREYAGKIKVARKYFLLSSQDNFMLPHIATRCANEQGKYWEYSDFIWQNTSQVDDEQLKKYARDLNLNIQKFNECLDSRKYKDDLQKESSEGRALGVSGTPAFFINGLLLSGARPFESFKEIIDKEL